MSTSLNTLFSACMKSLATGLVDRLGESVLPGAWPLARDALNPVLERMGVRLPDGDKARREKIAEEVIERFKNDRSLQEAWKTALWEGLDPVVTAQEKLGTGQQAIAWAIMGQGETLESIIKGNQDLTVQVREMEETLLAKLSEVSTLVTQTRDLARKKRHDWVPRSQLERQIHGKRMNAIEFIRRGQIKNALVELQICELVLFALIDETPMDPWLMIQQAAMYKDFGQALMKQGETAEASKCLTRVQEVCGTMRLDLIPGEQTKRYRAMVEVLYGNTAAIRGDHVAALRHYQAASRLDVAYSDPWHDMAVTYLIMAKEGDVDKEGLSMSIAELRKIAESDPNAARQLALVEGPSQQYLS